MLALFAILFHPVMAKSWPHIKSFHRSFELTDPSSMFVEFPILDVQNAVAYEVQCASGFSRDARMIHFAWSGDFECRVFVPNAIAMPDVQLLVERAHDRAVDSRGRFFWNQLMPGCISVPDWGGTRTFRFRNMALTIQISDPKIVPPKSYTDPALIGVPVQALRLDVKGDFDGGATRSFAGPPSHKAPRPVERSATFGPLNCSSPPKRRVPRGSE